MAAPVSAAERRRSIAGATACIAVFAFTLGLSLPLLALIMERDGWDPSLIGLNAAAYAVAMMLFSPLAPWLARVFGTIPLLLACTALTAAMLALLPAFPDRAAWFVVRFVLGFAIGTMFVVGEAWINEATSDATRGRVISIYLTVLSAGYALGPLVIPLTGIDGYAPFLVGCAVVASASLPLLWAARVAPSFRVGGGVPMWRFARLIPHLIAGVLLLGVIIGTAEALFPVYAVQVGVSQAGAALMISVIVLGNTVLQLPIGWLADRMDRERLLVVLGGGALAGAVALPFVMGPAGAVWPVLFFWGGAVMGIYTLAMTILGQRFAGADLVAGSAAFSIVYAGGNVLGPPLTGVVMEWLGPKGLPLTMAASCALFLVLTLAYRRQRRRRAVAARA
ncbi:MAG: MFS transporter [Alphaproteobacteria bacterium]|nr:MFS transporter [Alphaproteobacteria bacterium]